MHNGHDYASTQVQLPKEMAMKVKALAAQIPANDLAGDGVENDPHITVKYGLHHDSAARVKDVLKGEMPVRFTLGPTTVFPATDENQSDVLIVSAYSPDLHRLNQVVSAAAPHIDTHADYRPHATIAYLKPGSGIKYAGRMDLAGTEGLADAVIHSNRDGEKTQIPLAGKVRKASTVFARISTGAGEFKPALTLGHDWPYPKERNGKPCFYYWKPALTLGHKKTWGNNGKAGEPIDVTPDRIAKIVGDYKRAAATGYEAPLPDDHASPTKNYGWVKDARVGADGSLELLHQFVGEEEKNEALNKKTSICTVADTTDEYGNKYSELIDHQAIIINPQLNNLGDFTPALAANRGQAIEAVQFEMSAPEEIDMDLSKLREALGAAKEIPDDQILTQAVVKLGENKTALELSRGKETELATLKTRAETAERERDEHKAKALELSKGAVDAITLEDRRLTAEEVLATHVERGQCTDAMAAIIRENFIGKEGSPGLMLSRGARSGPVGAIFKLLELNRTLSGFRQTAGQSVPRNTPGAGDQTVSPERIKELRALAGVK